MFHIHVSLSKNKDLEYRTVLDGISKGSPRPSSGQSQDLGDDDDAPTSPYHYILLRIITEKYSTFQ